MSDNTDKLPPMHPGEVLREEFLVPMGLSAYAVAKAVHVTPQHIAANPHTRPAQHRGGAVGQALLVRSSGSTRAPRRSSA